MKIAVIDSGIHAQHPHIGSIAGAVHFTADGIGADPADRLGHGTAAAAAILEKFPAAQIFAVKIFDQRLAAPIGALLRALEWCRENQIDLINLSLGVSNPDHRAPLAAALRENALVVSAAGMLPGDLEEAIAADSSPACPRDRFRRRGSVFLASPYPRPIPGVPPEHNLHGVSFAVANMTGFVARALATTPRAQLRDELIRLAGLP